MRKGSRTLRTAGWTLAVVFRLIPRRFRFRAALSAAARLEPLMAHTRAYQARVRLGTDDLRETSLELVLMTLSRHRTRFDPEIRVEGADCLPAPGSGGILIAASHTMLSTLFARYLEDAGHAPIIIAADQAMHIPGTGVPARVLCPSASMLLKVRRLLKSGHTVAAMIDRSQSGRRTRTIPTAGGSMYVSEALFRVAARSGARIVFLATTLDAGSQVVSRLSVPSRGSADVREILDDFAAFVAS